MARHGPVSQQSLKLDDIVRPKQMGRLARFTYERLVREILAAGAGDPPVAMRRFRAPDRI